MNKLFILASLTLAGCTLPEKVTPGASNEVMRDLTYNRDQRTGLCYALISHATGQPVNGLTITWVPCEPLIAKGIIK